VTDLRIVDHNGPCHGEAYELQYISTVIITDYLSTCTAHSSRLAESVLKELSTQSYTDLHRFVEAAASHRAFLIPQ